MLLQHLEAPANVCSKSTVLSQRPGKCAVEQRSESDHFRTHISVLPTDCGGEQCQEDGHKRSFLHFGFCEKSCSFLDVEPYSRLVAFVECP